MPEAVLRELLDLTCSLSGKSRDVACRRRGGQPYLIPESQKPKLRDFFSLRADGIPSSLDVAESFLNPIGTANRTATASSTGLHSWARRCGRRADVVGFKFFRGNFGLCAGSDPLASSTRGLAEPEFF